MHDVAVIGGGPGGSTAAALLAGAGRDVVVLERERFPRFHVGESLLPWNMRIFERLGVVEALRGAFIDKWGVEFVSSRGDLGTTFHFDAALDSRYPSCFEVQRSRFDEILLRNAAARGADVREGVTVTEARRTTEGWTLGCRGEAGAPPAVKARFLVDASGRDGFMARRLGLREADPSSRRAALYAHYKGIPRATGRDAGNIVIVMMRDGWIWFIPFADGTTSVGLVADGESFARTRLSNEEALSEGIRRCPAARERARGAERITPVLGASDWSYVCRGIAGDGYLMVGDAAAFVDPVFSSGVLLAMTSAEAAAGLLEEALGSGRPSRARWSAYERDLLSHAATYRRMVDLFYSRAFASLCLSPSERFGLTGAVMSLLAGRLDPGWSVRWRLELFYALGALFNRLGVGPRVDLHGVFEEIAEPGTRGGRAA